MFFSEYIIHDLSELGGMKPFSCDDGFRVRAALEAGQMGRARWLDFARARRRSFELQKEALDVVD